MEEDSIVGSDMSMVLALRLDSRRVLRFTTLRAHLQHDTGTTLHSHSDGLGAVGNRIPPSAVILSRVVILTHEPYADLLGVCSSQPLRKTKQRCGVPTL